jgi:hypothetical protein
MRISSRWIIKEALSKPAFIESLKMKYGNDPDFMIKEEGKEPATSKDVVILINKYYGYKKLNSLNQLSEEYSSFIRDLPDRWRLAKEFMEGEINSLSSDTVKKSLTSLGLKEEDLVREDVRKWLEDRYVNKSITEVHPISEAIDTVKEYVHLKDQILNKLKEDDVFRNKLESKGFEKENIKDISYFSVDDMVYILGEFRNEGIGFAKIPIPEEEKVGKVGEWNIWLPGSKETSIEIAGYDEKTGDPKTTWCTARTKGSNLFYDYITNESYAITFLFYVIKDDPINPNDWLSVGFKGENLKSIKPVLDGQRGGLSVNRGNKGLKEEDFKEILGDNYDTIFSIMKNKINELGGENPASKKMKEFANNFSLFKKEVWNKSVKEREDFAKNILKRNPIDEVKGLATAIADPAKILKNTDKDWAKSYIRLAIEKALDKDPESFIYEFRNKDWARPYIELAIKNCVEKDPKHFITYLSKSSFGKPFAKKYLPIAEKSMAEKNPFDLLIYFKDEPWTKKYIALATKNCAEENPFEFLQYIADMNDNPWVEEFTEFAAEKYLNENPKKFLKSFLNTPWAKPYIPVAAKLCAEEYPIYIINEYRLNKDWVKPYIELAIKNCVERDSEYFLDYFSHENWAQEFIPLAQKKLTEANSINKSSSLKIKSLIIALQKINLKKEAAYLSKLIC